MALAMGLAMTVLARQTVQALAQAVANDAKPLDPLKGSPSPQPLPAMCGRRSEGASLKQELNPSLIDFAC
jgi:hypothetical protein